VTPNGPPRDPVPAGESEPCPFAAFTDPARALVLLQPCSAALFGAPTPLACCDVIDSLYKTYVNPASFPKSTLSVCWRLWRADAAGSAIFYAKVYLEGRSQAAWQRLGERGSDEATAPRAATHLPALDMIVWRFPHDPALRHLPEAVLDERVRARLPWDALRSHGGGAAEGASLHIEPVSYQPEKSCMTRCLLHWPVESRVEWPAGDGLAAAPRDLLVYAKTYGDDRGRAAHARQLHYWRSAALRTCEPLAYDDSIATVWSIGVEGQPLAHVIDDANQLHYLDQAAAHLWAVHSSDPHELGVDELIAPAELLADCLKKIDKLGRACPRSREALALVAVPVQALAERVMQADGQRCVLHGDFHIGQMLAAGGDVYLFDFDSLALGDAEQDLAEFVVALMWAPVAPEFVGTMAAALGHAYASRACAPVRMDHLRWYARVEFVTRCWRLHRQQRPGWADALELALTRLPTLDAAIAAMASAAATASTASSSAGAQRNTHVQ
jgi:hypothetical protein